MTAAGAGPSSELSSSLPGAARAAAQAVTFVVHSRKAASNLAGDAAIRGGAQEVEFKLLPPVGGSQAAPFAPSNCSAGLMAQPAGQFAGGLRRRIASRDLGQRFCGAPSVAAHTHAWIIC